MVDSDVLRVVGHKRKMDTWIGALMFLFIAAMLGSSILGEDPRSLGEKLPGFLLWLDFLAGLPPPPGASGALAGPAALAPGLARGD